MIWKKLSTIKGDNMSTLKIEFFHDVICSFCYPMSFRMRRIVSQIPEIEVIHRSFALAQSPDDLARMFGSHEGAKDIIMSHWEQANQNDTEHRFNIDGMKQESFLFPTSMQPLRAVKAAGMVGGEKEYWDVFDALQKGLFTDNLNINDEAIINDLAKPFVTNYERWQEVYQSQESLSAVKTDFEIGRNYGINSVPSLVIDGKYLINGAVPEDYLLKTLLDYIEEKKNKEGRLINKNPENESGESCNFVDGKWECD